jgi:hypothetical protein
MGIVPVHARRGGPLFRLMLAPQIHCLSATASDLYDGFIRPLPNDAGTGPGLRLARRLAYVHRTAYANLIPL